jgi:hypothetical protein
MFGLSHRRCGCDGKLVPVCAIFIINHLEHSVCEATWSPATFFNIK